MDSETDVTREIVTRFVRAWTSNDVPALVALLAPDAHWDTPRSIGASFDGPDAIARQLSGGAAGKYVKLDTVQRKVRHMVVDGPHAIVLVQLSATTHSGDAYVNEYAWHYEVADGLVREISEYADTLLAARLGFLPLQLPAE